MRRALCLLLALVPFHRAVGQCLRQTLVPSDAPGAALDFFGLTLAATDDVLVVGAPASDGIASNTGAAYVFRFDGTTWQEEQKLVAGDGASNDFFGLSVAIRGDGTWILIGAPSAAPQGAQSGAAYLFWFDGQQWQEMQKLTAQGAEERDRFGSAVAFQDDWAAVGLPGDRSACPSDPMCQAGAVDLFEFDGTLWQPRQQVHPANVASEDSFGTSLAMGPGRLVVGAPGGPMPGRVGDVYVFSFDGTAWNEGQRLQASVGDGDDQFGYAVALDGDVLAVGDPERGFPPPQETGQAYVFRFDGQAFVEEARLEPLDDPVPAYYGRAVALTGAQLLVSASTSDEVADDAGAVYLYRHDGLAWREHRKLLPRVKDTGQYFGMAAAWSDGQAAIGAPLPTRGRGVWIHDCPYLDLTLSPLAPQAGDTLTWALDQGLPRGRLLTAVVDVDGVPVWTLIRFADFDAAGRWSHADVVPPGLAGTQMIVLALGMDPCGAVGASDRGVLAFR